MAYDGRPYFSAPAIHARAWHSDAPLTGEVLHHALIGGYYSARKNSRLLFTYSRPANSRRPDISSISTGFALVQGTLTEVFTTDGYVPSEATAVYCAAYYGVIASAETTVAHTLTVREYAAVDEVSATETQAVQPSPLDSVFAQGGKSQGKEAAIPARDWWASSAKEAGYKELGLAVIRVDVSVLDKNYDLRITLETELNITASDLCMYQLLGAVGWWEVEE